MGVKDFLYFSDCNLPGLLGAQVLWLGYLVGLSFCLRDEAWPAQGEGDFVFVTQVVSPQTPVPF